MENTKQRPGRPRIYDFPSLTEVGSSIRVYNADVKKMRAQAMTYSALHHNGSWKFQVRQINDNGESCVEVKRVA